MSSFCTSNILELASGIYDGIGSPSSQSVGFISGWLTSSTTLGTLNNRLTTCFTLTGSEPCIAGGFGAAEAGILTLVYQSDYYRRGGQQALAGGGTFWTSIREGDTAIARESPLKQAAAYEVLRKGVEEKLSIAVANWKLGHSHVVSTDYTQLPSWPTP